jgi:hypothetical protein
MMASPAGTECGSPASAKASLIAARADVPVFA